MRNTKRLQAKMTHMALTSIVVAGLVAPVVQTTPLLGGILHDTEIAAAATALDTVQKAGMVISGNKPITGKSTQVNLAPTSGYTKDSSGMNIYTLPEPAATTGIDTSQHQTKVLYTDGAGTLKYYKAGAGEMTGSFDVVQNATAGQTASFMMNSNPATSKNPNVYAEIEAQTVGTFAGPLYTNYHIGGSGSGATRYNIMSNGYYTGTGGLFGTKDNYDVFAKITGYAVMSDGTQVKLNHTPPKASINTPWDLPSDYSWSNVKKVFFSGTSGFSEKDQMVVSGTINMPDMTKAGKYTLTSRMSMSSSDGTTGIDTNAVNVNILPIQYTDTGKLTSDVKIYDASGNDITSQNATYSGHSATIDQKLTSTLSSDSANQTYVVNGIGTLKSPVTITNDAGEDVSGLMATKPVIAYYDKNNKSLPSYVGASRAVVSNLTIQGGTSFHIKATMNEDAGSYSAVAGQLFTTYNNDTQSGTAAKDSAGNDVSSTYMWKTVGVLTQSTKFTDEKGNDITSQNGTYKGNYVNVDQTVSNTTGAAITGATYFVRTTGTATFTGAISVLDASGKDINSSVAVTYYKADGSTTTDPTQANRAVVKNVTVPLKTTDSTTGITTPGKVEIKASYKAGTTKAYKTTGTLYKAFDASTFTGTAYQDADGKDITSGDYAWQLGSVSGNVNYVDKETGKTISSTAYTQAPGSAFGLTIPDKYIQEDGLTSTTIPTNGGDVNIPVLALTEASVTNPNPAGTTDKTQAAKDTESNNGKRIDGLTISQVPSYSVNAGVGVTSVDLTADKNQNKIKYTNLKNAPVRLLVAASALTNSEHGVKLPVNSIMMGTKNIYADGYAGNGLVAGEGAEYVTAGKDDTTDKNPVEDGQHTITLPGTLQINTDSQYLAGTYSGKITYSIIEDDLSN
ncbi:hypothetical protein [Weissella cibaria]|uniref:hypothetical protein n=1 Tax=Weissella cibaria TaxID=137591 RepID=UPI00223BEB5C|nr:hypothetical protein [Weissella cibaria]MCT0021439.1 hypothetical protein [Weissella cibaria]